MQVSKYQSYATPLPNENQCRRCGGWKFVCTLLMCVYVMFFVKTRHPIMFWWCWSLSINRNIDENCKNFHIHDLDVKIQEKTRQFVGNWLSGWMGRMSRKNFEKSWTQFHEISCPNGKITEKNIALKYPPRRSSFSSNQTEFFSVISH